MSPSNCGQLGCWCDYGVYDEKLLYLVDEGIPKVAAAILKVRQDQIHIPNTTLNRSIRRRHTECCTILLL